MNILDVLRKWKVEHRTKGQHHHARHGWIQIDCPHCSPRTRRWRFGINERTGSSNCWVCGRHSLAGTLSIITGIGTHEIVQTLKGIKFQDRLKIPKRRKGTLKLPSHRMKYHPAHDRYLKGREFDPDEIRSLWEIESIGIAPIYSWTVFIPVHYKGEVVSWTTRSIGDLGARYVNAPPHKESIPINEVIYGEDFCRNEIVVVEGPLDVWRIGPGAVCTFGVNVTDEQVERICRYPMRTIIPDNEPRAIQRAKRLLDRLSPFKGSSQIAVLPDRFADPGEIDRQTQQEIRASFLPSMRST